MSSFDMGVGGTCEGFEDHPRRRRNRAEECRTVAEVMISDNAHADDHEQMAGQLERLDRQEKAPTKIAS
jgi:hypothetical protein